MLVLYFVIALAASAAGFFLARWLPMKRGMETQIEASNQTLANVLNMPQSIFSKSSKGHYYNLVTNASFIYGDISMTVSVQVVESAITVVVLLLMAWSVSAWVAGLFVCYAALYYLMVTRLSNLADQAQEESTRQRESWLDELQSIVENKKSINAIPAEEAFSSRFDRETSSYLPRLKRYRLLDTVASQSPAALSCILKPLTMLVGLVILASESITPGMLVACYQLTGILQTR